MLDDIWVNWFHDEEKAYGVCEFHEWRNPVDKVELLDTIPLIMITKDLFRYIENGINPLPIRLLEQIENKSRINSGKKMITLKYACILTDGNKVIVVDTNETQMPHKKSRMTPRQERVVLDLVNEELVRLQEFEYKPIHKKENWLISVPDECMIGLTRRERTFKELLFLIYDQLQDEDDLNKLRYYYSEWNSKGYSTIYELNYDELFTTLVSETKLGWNNAHHDLLKSLLKLNPIYKQIYNDEMSYKFEWKKII